MIAKCPKPPKDSEKRRKSEKSKEKGNRACDNSNDDDELKVYASMSRMSRIWSKTESPATITGMFHSVVA